MTMTQLLVRLLLSIAATVALCFAQVRPEGIGGPQYKASPALKCTVQVDNARISKGAPAMLHISLENLTSGSVRVTGLSVNLVRTQASQVVLGGIAQGQYYAPIDIDQKSALKPVHDSKGRWTLPKQRVTIAPGQHLEFQIDAAELNWEGVTSSVLPFSNLFGVVPDGAYSEYITAGVEVESNSRRTESNRIDIEVRRDISKR